jgi:ribA/ribD-fused uncharacterized protein
MKSLRNFILVLFLLLLGTNCSAMTGDAKLKTNLGNLKKSLTELKGKLTLLSGKLGDLKGKLSDGGTLTKKEEFMPELEYYFQMVPNASTVIPGLIANDCVDVELRKYLNNPNNIAEAEFCVYEIRKLQGKAPLNPQDEYSALRKIMICIYTWMLNGQNYADSQTMQNITNNNFSVIHNELTAKNVLMAAMSTYGGVDVDVATYLVEKFPQLINDKDLVQYATNHGLNTFRMVLTEAHTATTTEPPVITEKIETITSNAAEAEILGWLSEPGKKLYDPTATDKTYHSQINGKDYNAKFVLFEAVSRGDSAIGVVRYLLDKQYSDNGRPAYLALAKGKNKRTALDVAIYNNKTNACPNLVSFLNAKSIIQLFESNKTSPIISNPVYPENVSPMDNDIWNDMKKAIEGNNFERVNALMPAFGSSSCKYGKKPKGGPDTRSNFLTIAHNALDKYLTATPVAATTTTPTPIPSPTTGAIAATGLVAVEALRDKYAALDEKSGARWKTILNDLSQKSTNLGLLKDFFPTWFDKSPNSDWYTHIKQNPAEVGGKWDPNWPEIQFYKEGANYGAFSNFWPWQDGKTTLVSGASIPTLLVNGQNWNSTETYFQCQKFNYTGCLFANPVNINTYPMDALTIAGKKGLDGKTPEYKINDFWHSYNNGAGYKVAVMYYVLLHKFTQNNDLMNLLLSTDGKILVEYNTSQAQKDDFWSVRQQSNNQGRNCLGILLMHIRDQLLGK